jgi:hypothetical protein
MLDGSRSTLGRRYPGESEEATLAEAEEGLVLARKIVAAVSGLIPTAKGGE